MANDVTLTFQQNLLIYSSSNFNYFLICHRCLDTETVCSFLSAVWMFADVTHGLHIFSSWPFGSDYIIDIIIIMGTPNTHGIIVKGRPTSQVFSQLYRKERTAGGQRRKPTSSRFSSAEIRKNARQEGVDTCDVTKISRMDLYSSLILVTIAILGLNTPRSLFTNSPTPCHSAFSWQLNWRET